MGIGKLFLHRFKNKYFIFALNNIASLNSPFIQEDLKHIANITVYLSLPAPQIKERVLYYINRHSFTDHKKAELAYIQGLANEGDLNIYVNGFESGKCRINFIGIINGREIKEDIELSKSQMENFDYLVERLRYVLGKSLIILKKYYEDDTPNKIKEHLIAFLYEI